LSRKNITTKLYKARNEFLNTPKLGFREIKTKMTLKKNRNHKVVKTHKQIAKTSPILFVPALIILISAVVFGSMGNTNRVGMAKNIEGAIITQKASTRGLIISLDFNKNSESYNAVQPQKIYNLVDKTQIGVLGQSDKEEDSDPSFDQNGFFTFDGQKQIISLDGKNAPKSDFTYEMWVRADQNDNPVYAVSTEDKDSHKNTAGVKIKDNYWWFMGFNDGNMVYIPYPDKAIDQSWHHVAVTRNSETLAIFLDGLPAEVTRGVNKYSLSNDFITIGGVKEGDKYDEFFKGDIAQLRIYARALTNDEVLSNLKNTQPDFIKTNILNKEIDMGAEKEKSKENN
jgi:hypothetical protein